VDDAVAPRYDARQFREALGQRLTAVMFDEGKMKLVEAIVKHNWLMWRCCRIIQFIN
jgi:hypothetical protein